MKKLDSIGTDLIKFANSDATRIEYDIKEYLNLMERGLLKSQLKKCKQFLIKLDGDLITIEKVVEP